MSNNLTDREFWKNYWESKKDLIFKIKPDYTFYKLLSKLIIDREIKSAIELGGFPGYYAVFLKKYFDLEVTLFDYFIHPKIIKNLLVENDLSENDVKIIEADVFKYESIKKYDLVCSVGLIEHFENTKDIINKHLNFLKDDGTLFITIPNFKGINGWVQKSFDSYNYNKHNIACMDLGLLSEIAKDLGLKDIKVYYYGGYSVWLENKDAKSVWVKSFVKGIWYVGKVFIKIFKFESKALSPYIILEAKK